MDFLNLKASLSLNGSGFAMGLKRAESQGKQFAQSLKSELAKAFGTAAIAAYTARIIEFADNLTDVSDQLGISTKELQEWAYAAKQSGKNIQDVTMFLEGLARARERALGGDAGALSSFNQLNISEGDLRSKTLNDLGRQVASATEGGNIHELRDALRDLGGKGATGLVATLKSLRELAPLAPIISDEHIENIKEAKAELLGLADSLLPAGNAVGGFASAVSNGITAISMGLSSMKAAGSTILSGGGASAAWKAANEAFDKGFSEWERRQKAKQENIAVRAAISQTTGEELGDRQHDATPMERLRKIVGAGGLDSPELNSWQKLGAGVRFAPSDNPGQQVARNTERALGYLEQIAEASQSFRSLNGLGAEISSGF